MGLVILLIFILGYVAIALEDVIKIKKTASALFTAVLCWALYALSGISTHEAVETQLGHNLEEIAQIVFFLLGAMTIVELIDLHDGFSFITNRIKAKNVVQLMWIISWLTFFLSALLDNLTTAIVMATLLRKLVKDHKLRRYLAGLVVIAANAGGAWSPIGDVTTTMLWIGGQITPLNIMATLILPSIVCLLIPLLVVSFLWRGKELERPDEDYEVKLKKEIRGSTTILIIGIGALIFVPIFKVTTHLPPYMGMMFGLAVLWIATELIHRGDEHVKEYSAVRALEKIDTPSILFFFGILAAVGSLDALGWLSQLSQGLDRAIGDKDWIVGIIGAGSSVVDNVPLLAATQKMYSLTDFPTDHKMWEFLAYATGTGGSLLIIGSAAGVAIMGQEKLTFGWYLKNMSLLALIGYVAGAIVYLSTWHLFRLH